ncbi:LysR family transcriptional regulator, partial [Pseudomonas sp. CrR25]|nr:LysR family transcriptional regulator [Pseudomonas sp. CrR25]
VLSPLLAQFMARYPRLSVELTLDDRLLDVVAEGFDVSLRIRAELVDSSLIARRLGETAQILCASPDYLEAQGIPAKLEDLHNHACLAYRLADHPGHWRLEGPQGEVSVQLPARFSADNSLILCDVLLAGTGIGALPSFIAQPLLDNGQLRRVLPDYHFSRRGIYALYSSKRHVPRKVRAFVDFLAEALAQRSQPHAVDVAAG